MDSRQFVCVLGVQKSHDLRAQRGTEARQRAVCQEDVRSPARVSAREACADAFWGREQGPAEVGARQTRAGAAGATGGERGAGSGGGEVTGGPHSGLGAIADADVREDAREVRFHGALSDAELVGDDAVGHALAYEPEYLELA